VFVCNNSGAVTVLYNFTTADGSPLYGLVQSGSVLYGATFPNPDGLGEVYSFSLATQTFNIVFPFSGDSHGGSPATALFSAGDGELYGTTQSGGSGGTGTLFELNALSSPRTLYDFPPGSLNTYTDAALLHGSDGNFYDAVQYDSTSGLDSSEMDGAGTIFRLTPPQVVPPPIVLTASMTNIGVNRPFTLSWNAPVAVALSSQQCFAASSGPGSIPAWSGSKLTSGFQSMTLNVIGVYSLSLTCGGNVSATASVTVGEALSAAMQLTGPSNVQQGQHATLVASVTSSSRGGLAPTGTVTFIADGTISIASVNLTSGSATFTASTAGVPPGVYEVTAQYSGDSTYAANTSPAIKVTVVSSLLTTATTLTATPDPAKSGETVTLTATVKLTSGSDTPTGSVQFLFQGMVIDTVKLSGGIATFRASTTGIASGSYGVSAEYLGETGVKASTSPSVTVTLTN
jgi:uncharacterized repeat protein (TIGR03803 family)